MHDKINVGKVRIGKGQPCFIIAEAGVNHNGEIVLAKKLIDVAKQAGADAVKFQTFKAEKLVVKDTEKAAYQKESTGNKESQYEMIKKLELSEANFKELADYCKKSGIMFLSTPFDFESVEIVNKLCPLFKISSTDTNNYPFLEYVAKKGKLIILSTGMANMGEVEEAVKTIEGAGNNNLILLQCVTSYPAKLEDANVLAMLELQKLTPIVGYSDHTLGNYAAYAAVALGAKVIEKHFTLDKNMSGPDHKASLSPEELKEFVSGIRNIEKCLGNGKKEPLKIETEISKIARKHIVASKEIIEGQTLTSEMIEIKRSKSGFDPEYLNKIIGKTAKKRIKKDEGLNSDNVSI